MKFNLKNFIIFFGLFITEALIAKYVTQPFIRYWFGDFLIVILIYYFLKSFIATKPLYLAIATLIFSYIIEFIQLTSLLDILDLRHNRIANLILGNTFSVSDLVAYTLGVITVFFIEKNDMFYRKI